MAYAPPKRWTHGDLLTASDLNTLSTGISEVQQITGLMAIEPCAPAMNLKLTGITMTLVQACVFVHKKRYLHYKGNGKITNLSQDKETSISDSGTPSSVYDLETINWLGYGMIYRVTGDQMIFCAEDDE